MSTARGTRPTMNDSGREVLRLNALRRVQELEVELEEVERRLARAREHLALYESDCD